MKKILDASGWIVLLIILGYSCSPSKYKAVSLQYGTPPITTMDSNWLAGRCAVTYPAKIIEVILPAPPDSSSYFKTIADSMAGIKPTVIERLRLQYKDTCTTAIKQYDDGFNLGYQVGKSEGKASSESKFKILLDKKDVDCNTEIQKAMQAEAYLIAECKTANSLQIKENEKLEAKVVKQGKKIATKNKENWIWRIIALALLAWQGWKFYKRLTTIKIS